tara:strand:- start:48 stop:257 length:210 start_codon:yes stop_codon:yes gene_type:complete
MKEVIVVLDSIQGLFYILFFFGALNLYEDGVIDLNKGVFSAYLMKISAFIVLTTIIIEILLRLCLFLVS